MIMRTVRNQSRTTQEDLVNDLQAAGTTFTKKTIGNTLQRERLKSQSAHKVSLLKKAHVQARLKFANDSMYRQGQGIKNGSWMGILAWQWPKTHGQGNTGVAQEEAH